MRFYGNREANAAVIEGKKYDATADNTTEIATHQDGYGNSFGDYRETLYVTNNGSYFVCGSGGAQTRWSSYDGNMHGPGSGVVAMTMEEALRWCEQHDVDVDVVEEHFDIEEA